MTTPTIPAPLPALEWEVPLVNPSPSGLYAATTWTEVTGPSRFLGAGVRFRSHNYGGEAAFGVWDAEWCVDPEGQLKDGVRPEFLDPFAPVTVWAYDECDLTAPSQAEVRERVAQNLRLIEQTAVEREFAARLLIDGGTPAPAATLADAVAHLEQLMAESNTLGYIHASAGMAAWAAKSRLIVGSGKTPMGHTWVFGGGYVAGLGNTLVATSPTFGWRDPVEVRETLDPERNLFAAVAERSLVIGYEQGIGAADVTDPTGGAVTG